MTIQDANLLAQSLWDWSILDGCFGDSKIRVGDIDGFVERRGQLLFIETKHTGSHVPRGQLRAYKALVKLGCTVLIVWGVPGSPKRIRVITPAEDRVFDHADLDLLRALVGQWYEWADKGARHGKTSG